MTTKWVLFSLILTTFNVFAEPPRIAVEMTRIFSRHKTFYQAMPELQKVISPELYTVLMSLSENAPRPKFTWAGDVLKVGDASEIDFASKTVKIYGRLCQIKAQYLDEMVTSLEKCAQPENAYFDLVVPRAEAGTFKWIAYLSSYLASTGVVGTPMFGVVAKDLFGPIYKRMTMTCHKGVREMQEIKPNAHYGRVGMEAIKTVGCTPNLYMTIQIPGAGKQTLLTKQNQRMVCTGTIKDVETYLCYLFDFDGKLNEVHRLDRYGQMRIYSEKNPATLAEFRAKESEWLKISDLARTMAVTEICSDSCRQEFKSAVAKAARAEFVEAPPTAR
jgi:hypothetical protein